MRMVLVAWTVFVCACINTVAAESPFAPALTKLAADVESLQSDIGEWRQGAFQRKARDGSEQIALTEFNAAELLQDIAAKSFNLLLAANSIEELLPTIEATNQSNIVATLSKPLVHHLRALNRDLGLTLIDQKEVPVWRVFSRRTHEVGQRCVDQAVATLNRATSILDHRPNNTVGGVRHPSDGATKQPGKL